MSEKDLIFYMGGDIFYKDKKIANLKVEGPPLRYVLVMNTEKTEWETREKAVEKIIKSLENEEDD